MKKKKNIHHIMGGIALVLLAVILLNYFNLINIPFLAVGQESPQTLFPRMSDEEIVEMYAEYVNIEGMDDGEILEASTRIFPPGEYRANGDCSLITNIRGGGWESYSGWGKRFPISFIALDANNDGEKEGYYYDGGIMYTYQREICDNYELITTTPEGLRVVKSDRFYELGEIWICTPPRYEIDLNTNIQTPIEDDYHIFRPFKFQSPVNLPEFTERNTNYDTSDVITECTPCIIGDERCDGYILFKCVDRSWRNYGILLGKCGYTIDQSLIDEIEELQLTVEERARLIDELELNLEEQAILIAQLELTTQQKIELIAELTSNIEEQARIIENLELTRQQQVVYIEELTQNIEEQAEMINALSINLQEKADLVNLLQVENEKQAQLISEMRLSFSEQAEIINALNKEIEDDAVIISNLDLKLSEQGEIIANMKLTNEEQAALVEALTTEVDEQAEIIASLRLTLEQERELVRQLREKVEEQKELLDKIKNVKAFNYWKPIAIILGGFALLLIIILIFSKRKH